MFDPQLLQMMLAQQGRGMNQIQEQKPWSKYTKLEKAKWLAETSLSHLSTIGPFLSFGFLLAIVWETENISSVDQSAMGGPPIPAAFFTLESRLRRFITAFIPIPRFQ